MLFDILGPKKRWFRLVELPYHNFLYHGFSVMVDS